MEPSDSYPSTEDVEVSFGLPMRYARKRYRRDPMVMVDFWTVAAHELVAMVGTYLTIASFLHRHMVILQDCSSYLSVVPVSAPIAKHGVGIDYHNCPGKRNMRQQSKPRRGTLTLSVLRWWDGM
jgi:hypothetical protein